jgi:hypothetical protein
VLKRASMMMSMGRALALLLDPVDDLPAVGETVVSRECSYEE